ncbi:hypothetical protein F0L74_32335 [Chitinophaga agrisoli]|uniref:DUF4595 domain-containing protein n=1 Tax=Chitinophaga agrisoli TaxID=2607653 RepID=A0A5B2VP41_9BACT|nr:hypothetical protein [Chitinophaga agrisoli]KAA2240825.1 hypothetical protein F0L74_32335 [Chitinophaga agrisoli]
MSQNPCRYSLSGRTYLLPYLLLTFAAIVMVSCGKDDVARPQQPRIDSLHSRFVLNASAFNYSILPIGAVPTGDPFPMVLFSYRDGKPYLRTGYGIELGFINVRYSRLVYDSVAYNGNSLITTITITRHYRGTDINMPPRQRDIVLENGRMLQQITEKDTTRYYYDGNKLSRREIRSKSHRVTQQFYFNLSGNLEKVTSRDSSNYDNALLGTTEETFSGYDNSPNPFRQRFLMIWEDLFYRSLSVNNYTQYNMVTYTPGIDIPAMTNIVSTFYYRNDGTLDFTK